MSIIPDEFRDLFSQRRTGDTTSLVIVDGEEFRDLVFAEARSEI